MKKLLLISDGLTNLVHLECHDLSRLKKLHTMPNLEELTLHTCPLFTTLPVGLDRLSSLDCSYSHLVSIPFLPALVMLVCEGCPLLVSIDARNIQLDRVICSFCPQLITVPEDVALLRTGLYEGDPIIGTPWLHHHNNPDGEKNLRLLSSLQRFARNIKVWRFVRLILSRQFNEYYFSPERVGGRLAKKSILSVAKRINHRKRQPPSTATIEEVGVTSLDDTECSSNRVTDGAKRRKL